MNLLKLKQEIPFEWIEDYSNEEFSFLKTFIKGVDIEDKLDEVCSPEKWSCDYVMVGDTKMFTIGILSDKTWVGKSGDSFYKAARKWGIGREEYRLTRTIPSIKNDEDKWVPGHDMKLNGPSSEIPIGVLKKDSLEIKDINGYVEFLSTKSTTTKESK